MEPNMKNEKWLKWFEKKFQNQREENNWPGNNKNEEIPDVYMAMKGP